MKDLLIEKKKTFQRSVNIKSDLNNIELLETFIPSMTGNKTLSEFCKNIASGQGAYTWTGAYGSGKSTLAVILSWGIFSTLEAKSLAIELAFLAFFNHKSCSKKARNCAEMKRILLTN